MDARLARTARPAGCGYMCTCLSEKTPLLATIYMLRTGARTLKKELYLLSAHVRVARRRLDDVPLTLDICIAPLAVKRLCVDAPHRNGHPLVPITLTIESPAADAKIVKPRAGIAF